MTNIERWSHNSANAGEGPKSGVAENPKQTLLNGIGATSFVSSERSAAPVNPVTQTISLRLEHALFEQTRLNDKMAGADLVDDCPSEWAESERALKEVLEAITVYPGSTLEAVGWKALCHQRAAAIIDSEDPRLIRLAVSVTEDLSALLHVEGRDVRAFASRRAPPLTWRLASFSAWPGVNRFWRSGRRSHAGE